MRGARRNPTKEQAQTFSLIQFTTLPQLRLGFTPVHGLETGRAPLKTGRREGGGRHGRSEGMQKLLQQAYLTMTTPRAEVGVNLPLGQNARNDAIHI